MLFSTFSGILRNEGMDFHLYGTPTGQHVKHVQMTWCLAVGQNVQWLVGKL